MSSLPRLTTFALLPPTESGIADYCFDLVPHFRGYFDVTYVIDDAAPDPVGLPAGTEVIRMRDLGSHPESADDLPRLYQMGNNPFHTFMRHEAERRPGITVLHDFVLSHSLCVDRRPPGHPGSYAERLAIEHGEKGKAIARLREQGVTFDNDPYRLPLNGYVLDRSLGVIVHSLEAERRVRYLRPQLPVRRIPHHSGNIAPPDDLEEARRRARQKLGLDPGKLIFLSLGFVTPPKQVGLAVAALGKIRDRLPPFELLLVGEYTHSVPIRNAVDVHGMQWRVRSTGYVSFEQLTDYILAGDAVINLRYPSGCETSGTLTRAMALGRPAVIYNYDSFADYPAETAVKLPLNTHDTMELEAALLRLGRDPAYRERIGKAAAAYMRKHQAIDQCAAAYAAFIHETADRRAAAPIP